MPSIAILGGGTAYERYVSEIIEKIHGGGPMALTLGQLKESARLQAKARVIKIHNEADQPIAVAGVAVAGDNAVAGA